MNLIQEIVSDEIVGLAFAWLRKRRRNYSPNDDVWNVVQRWDEIKPRLRRQLMDGSYRFSPLQRIQRGDEVLDIWCALDALVLKAIAIVMTRYLEPRLSKRCFHLVGHGGAKKAVREVVERTSLKLPSAARDACAVSRLDPTSSATREAQRAHAGETAGEIVCDGQFVLRTDVKNYYASIDHDVLFSQISQHITDPRLLELLWQYMRRSVYNDGLYHDITKGISLGCPLSPLMGALYLDELDRAMEETGLFYARFMDDWVVLAPTRWKLRKAIQLVNRILVKLKVEKHPDKTFIGRTERGFDFLGYRFSKDGLKIAHTTCQKMVQRVVQLYEQGADTIRIGQYLQYWHRWVHAGLSMYGPPIDGIK